MTLQGDQIHSEQIKPPKVAHYERIQWIRDTITERARELKPKAIGIEGFAFAQAHKAHELGGLGYAVRIDLIEAGYTVFTVPIGTNKKFVTDKGNSPKSVMILYTFKRWGFETASDDIADAHGVARCVEAYHSDLQTQRVQQVRRKLELVR